MFKYSNKSTELQKLSAGTFQREVKKVSHMEVKWIFMRIWKINLDSRTTIIAYPLLFLRTADWKGRLSEMSAVMEIQIKEGNEQYIVPFIYWFTRTYYKYFMGEKTQQKVYILKPAEIVCFDNNFKSQQAQQHHFRSIPQ